MAYIFFYTYLVFAVLSLFICHYFRRFRLEHIIVGISTTAFSIVVDVVLGEWLGYYFYLDHKNSVLYMALSSIFLYPVLNMIYVLFLPDNGKRFLQYTAVWTFGLLLFEYLSLVQNIIIFTGWKPIPWSLTLYALTYLWINLLFKYVKKRHAKGTDKQEQH